MASISSPALPVLSDPALLDHLYDLSQYPVTLPSSTYSDELEAIRLTNQERIAQKNKEGQVIQHRTWNLSEAFRSDSDWIQGSYLLYPKPNFVLRILKIHLSGSEALRLARILRYLHRHRRSRCLP